MQKNYKEKHLKLYAAKSTNSKGRLYKEAENSIRSPYQRDRDRIIHSSSFRRLKHKTQVFVNTEGDHYRTRLTHSMEVSQIARTLARSLGLNEDLSMTIFSCFESLSSIILSKVKSYLKPEHPPPLTLILKKVPDGFFDISWLILSTAFLLKLISLIIFT